MRLLKDWKRSIHNFYENKVHNISEAKKGNTIKNVWGKSNLAKEGKDVEEFFKFLKTHLELRDVWHLINEDIVVHDIPIEFEKHIERVVLDDDDRILDEYYNNSSNRKFMKEEFRCLNNLIYKMFIIHYLFKYDYKTKIEFILYPFSSKNLWENPTYKTDDLIIESTWNHDFVEPALITYYMASKYAETGIIGELSQP
ncbi:hypothetical protein F8M41_025851 [Gigaspora margarita]|uniref:Uncharacterized protein n=1 Tax=Gigaspora margarita TaxID=4874 RepID=A0A8H4ABG3_GIGMA|nr:hypothetical protein F8M41_025851 [Gigaspora margarita]